MPADRQPRVRFTIFRPTYNGRPRLLDYLWGAPRKLIVITANLAGCGRILRKPVNETCTHLPSLCLRILFWALYPLALYLYERDRTQGRFRIES